MMAERCKNEGEGDLPSSGACAGLPVIRQRYIAGDISAEQAIQLSEDHRNRAMADEAPPF